MKQLITYSILVACLVLVACSKSDEPDNESTPQEVVFTARTYTFANADRPYRRAGINPKEGVTPSVIVYLHGGSAKGNDNSKQMEEPGIKTIADYASAKGISAVFIVPQCPEKDSQGKMMDWVKMGKALEFLIKSEMISPESRVYIFGGSMGGTGTWNMLSSYPDLFTAGMACAGNPKACDASNVAKTPVYAVMGGSDTIMKPDEVNLQLFLDDVKTAGGLYKFDTEDDWDHEKTCKESYTSRRLDWVFSHR